MKGLAHALRGVLLAAGVTLALLSFKSTAAAASHAITCTWYSVVECTICSSDDWDYVEINCEE